MFSFGGEFARTLQLGLGKWPFEFMQEEMDAALLFCSNSDDCLMNGAVRVEVGTGVIVGNPETVRSSLEKILRTKNAGEAWRSGTKLPGRGRVVNHTTPPPRATMNTTLCYLCYSWRF